MLDRIPRIETALPDENAIVLGTFDVIQHLLPGFKTPPSVPQDSWCVKYIEAGGHRHTVITSPNDRGVLYGVFALLRQMALQEPLTRLDRQETPYAPIRVVNQWDNPDGTIERGYAGRSIFWENDHVTRDLTRVGEYARLLASIGINGCSINNVNADARAISTPYLPEIGRVAEVFRPWGVRLFLCIDFSSPRSIGGLDTFDPLDPRVAAFWKDRVDEIYRQIPDFGGFVLKADSEGRLGPSAYGRSHADAANMIARTLKPHGGILFYRGFVYDHHADWRNLKNDRARAACDNFRPLDGQFDDNVVIQIKNGPIDFQVREPASPLFAALEKSSQAIELQITQEYTGQQRHLCFLVPMWKEVLDFDLHARGNATPVKALVAGKTFRRSLGGFVGVSNVGRDTHWLGHPLAMANLYGFGRLAWNPDLSGRQIAEEWTRLTFGDDRRVVETIAGMQLRSWKVYEDYTGPLGAGGLTDIIHVHFGPGIESSERNGWGQWHRGDEKGIGMDRTTSTGTGFIGQYPAPVARVYESLKTCPDELLLFFHHVPYDHVLHSGKTVIQHVYDTHYAGAAEAQEYVCLWKTLKGHVDEERYQDVLARLEYQAGHAIVWRDAVCQWFLKMSGIEDNRGRAGHYPHRIEAEAMKLAGYEVIDIKPWETASGGKAVQCIHTNSPGSVSFRYEGKPGWYDLAVQYFDENDGVSQFKLFAGRLQVDQWLAEDTLPSDLPNGHTSTRRTARGIALRPGDEIRIESMPEGGEKACLDYVEIEPHFRSW
jgi:alpha-glucuronidase